MARRKRSRRHKHHNNRNHFSSAKSDSTKANFLFELNVASNTSNFISSLEDTIVILTDRCLESPEILKINDCIIGSNSAAKFRSHSCVAKLHCSNVEEECRLLPQSDHIIETPKCSYKNPVSASIDNKDEEKALVKTKNDLVDECSTNEKLKFVDALDTFVVDVPDFHINKFEASTPLSLDITDNGTQTECIEAYNLGSKRCSLKNYLPKYKVRIRNCDVSLKKVYCNKILAPTEVRAFKTCIQVVTIIQEFHANYTHHIGKRIIKICWWLGMTFTSGITAAYKLYIDHRACSTLRSEICLLNDTIKALVIDNTLLRSEFHDIKQELKEIKAGTSQGFGIHIPPPPPPPPPPPLPTLLLPSMTQLNNQKQNTLEISCKKSHDQSSRPIISLDDILKVKLRKIAERPSPLRRITDPLNSNTLKHVRLRPTSPKTFACSSIETPSTESSLSNSPQTSLTRLLKTVDTKVRRVKRLQRHSAYSSDHFSRCSPQSQRDRRNFHPVSLID